MDSFNLDGIPAIAFGAGVFKEAGGLIADRYIVSLGLL